MVRQTDKQLKRHIQIGKERNKQIDEERNKHIDRQRKRKRKDAQTNE